MLLKHCNIMIIDYFAQVCLACLLALAHFKVEQRFALTDVLTSKLDAQFAGAARRTSAEDRSNLLEPSYLPFVRSGLLPMLRLDAGLKNRGRVMGYYQVIGGVVVTQKHTEPKE